MSRNVIISALLRIGINQDKFAHTGLTPVRSSLGNTPYVKEFPIVLECKFLHTQEIGLHTQFICEVLDVNADPDVLDGTGSPDIDKARPVIFGPGIRKCYGIGDCLGKAFSIGMPEKQ